MDLVEISKSFSWICGHFTKDFKDFFPINRTRPGLNRKAQNQTPYFPICFEVQLHNSTVNHGDCQFTIILVQTRRLPPSWWSPPVLVFSRSDPKSLDSLPGGARTRRTGRQKLLYGLALKYQRPVDEILINSVSLIGTVDCPFEKIQYYQNFGVHTILIVKASSSSYRYLKVRTPLIFVSDYSLVFIFSIFCVPWMRARACASFVAILG